MRAGAHGMHAIVPASVRTEEPTKNSVSYSRPLLSPASRQCPAVHVDDVKLIQYSIPRIATVQAYGVERNSLLAPCIV